MTVMTANLTGIDIRAGIEHLRKERNAVILAHYYQKPCLLYTSPSPRDS